MFDRKVWDKIGGQKITRFFWYLVTKKKCLFCNMKIADPFTRYDKKKGVLGCIPMSYFVHVQTSHGYDPDLLTDMLEE